MFPTVSTIYNTHTVGRDGNGNGRGGSSLVRKREIRVPHRGVLTVLTMYICIGHALDMYRMHTYVAIDPLEMNVRVLGHWDSPGRPLSNSEIPMECRTARTNTFPGHSPPTTNSPCDIVAVLLCVCVCDSDIVTSIIIPHHSIIKRKQ